MEKSEYTRLEAGEQVEIIGSEEACESGTRFHKIRPLDGGATIYYILASRIR